MTGQVRTMKARQSAVERRPSKYATACDAIGRDAVSPGSELKLLTAVPALHVSAYRGSAYRGSARRQRN